MNYINITVRGKIARAEGRARVVCGNSDYAVRFDFDEEWSEYALKTARFVSEDGSYTDVQFEGDTCAVPILRNTRTLLVGVFAGNLRTTTAALIHAVPCITDPDGTPADPTPDVYAQLMERFNAMEAPAAVLYTAQELTNEQKATARENIGVATPDWEQNDETAADYIKNRPFYEGVIETLLDPTIENWRKNASAKCSWRVAGVDYIDVHPSDLEHGAGFKYKLGDVTVEVYHAAGFLSIKPSDADVHILKRESNIKQIDPKFIPERLFDATGATNAEITAALQENKLCYVRDADGFWFCNSYDYVSSVNPYYFAVFYRITTEGINSNIGYISKQWTSDDGFDDKRVIEAVSTIALKDMAMTVVDAYDEISPQSVKTVNGICVGAGSSQGGKAPPSGMTFPIIFSLGPTSHGTGSAWIRDADGVVWKGSTDYGTLRVTAVPDVHLGMTGATVGQIAKITAVDDSGKPTAWEAVDMASGGVEWYEVIDTETAEDVNDLIISTDKNGRPISGYHALAMVLCFMIPEDSTQTSVNGSIWVYPMSNNHLSSSPRIIATVAAWKTIPRTFNYLYAGSNRAMFFSGAVGAKALDGSYNDVFSGVRLYVHNADDHLPAGTRVRCLVLSKGWTA